MTNKNQPTVAGGRQFYWSLAFVSLRYRDFRFLWFGSVTEHLGEFMEIAVILWLVNELAQSAFMLTIVASARFVAMIFLPLVTGVIADRANRRNMLLISLVASGILSLCIVLLAGIGKVAVWHLIAINLLSGVAMSFNHPARQTIIPNLVRREHLLNAVSLDMISVQGARMIGMFLAGYLIALLGAWTIFLFRALGCLLAIYWLLMADIPPTPALSRQHSPLKNLIEGFQYFRFNSVIFILVTLYLIPWLTSNTFTSFLPVFAKDILNTGPVGYGYLQAAPGFGSILSLIGLTLLTYYQRKARLLVGFGMILGVSLICLSLSGHMVVTLFFLVAVGAMLTAFSSINTAIIQSAVADELRGRVMSWREVAFGLGPAGSIIFGAIAQYTGVCVSLAIQGVIILATMAFLAIYFPRFKDIDSSA